MNKWIALFLVLAFLLTGCSRNPGFISEEEAIAIAFSQAVGWTDAPLTMEMGNCALVYAHDAPCYEVTFDAQTAQTRGISVIIIVRINPETGEVLEIIDAA